MCKWAEAAAAFLLTVAVMPAFAQNAYPGIGRNATTAEVAAWDIDVRADFKGLPAGSGSVAKGQEIWEAKCAGCHGVFGESTQFFMPLVGGTTAEDAKSGRVATLKRTDYPMRTTLMKLSTVSTLWDYIRRAMPWNEPKSLGVDEVYAVTAYMLHLGEVIPADFTLSDRNIAQVQQRAPNRNGFTRDHALWPGNEFGAGKRPDVAGSACMNNCAAKVEVTSAMPQAALAAHGNLAEQNRLVGAQRGIRTGMQVNHAAPASVAASGAPGVREEAHALTQQNNCIACHAADRRVVGPSWAEIAARHAGKPDYIASKIRAGGSGVWGPIPMPPQTLGEAETRRIADWLANGARN
jgi:S-disulfanyl-L-cysteine oxidoreductase SoxD